MTPQQQAELQAEQALAQQLHAQRQANLLLQQQAQLLGGSGDRVVTNAMFAPGVESALSRMRVLDQRVRGGRTASQMTPLGNLHDAQAHPTHALSETVFDYSQLLEGFQLPLTQISNRMKEEQYLISSTTGERISRETDRQALVSNLKELANITTGIASCLESVVFQSRSQTMGGPMGMPSMQMMAPAGMPMGMPGMAPLQPATVQRRQTQEQAAAQHAQAVARAQAAQLAQAQVQAAQTAQAQARRRTQGDGGADAAASAPAPAAFGPAPPPP